MGLGGGQAADFRRFVDLLEPALREAASHARSLEGRVVNSPKLGEITPVKQAMTQADATTQEILLRALLAHYPDVCLAAEEDTESIARFPVDSAARVIIDPIDGTLHSYLEAKGPYATIVGLVVDDRYRAGLVGLPREGLFFAASRGDGARIGLPGRPMREVRAHADGERVLVANNTPAIVAEYLGEQGFEVIFACGGAVSVAPLIPGVRAGLRWAPGESGISIRGRVGALISREAGALVRCGADREFPDDTESPAPVLLAACSEKDIALLRDALEAGGLPADP
jgi:fructose-1,6-bisphosphatase/inositol monophosphatase family enzyme